MNSDLPRLQSWFLQVCTHPQSVAAGLDAAQGFFAVANESELEGLVRPGPRSSASQRLDVYRESYVARLVECLSDDYPALQYALGDQDFAQLARGYVDAHPSRSASLNYFGRDFASFCAQQHGSERAFSAELARLEWALVEAIHAPESQPIAADRLADIAPEAWPNARFAANPSLCVLCFDHPVNAFYQAYRDDRAPELPAPAASAVAVYRCGNALWRADLAPARCALLSDLLAGSVLGEALERAAADGGASEADVLAWFGEWMRDGFFSAISV